MSQSVKKVSTLFLYLYVTGCDEQGYVTGTLQVKIKCYVLTKQEIAYFHKETKEKKKTQYKKFNCRKELFFTKQTKANTFFFLHNSDSIKDELELELHFMSFTPFNGKSYRSKLYFVKILQKML